MTRSSSLLQRRYDQIVHVLGRRLTTYRGRITTTRYPQRTEACLEDITLFQSGFAHSWHFTYILRAAAAISFSFPLFQPLHYLTSSHLSRLFHHGPCTLFQFTTEDDGESREYSHRTWETQDLSALPRKPYQ
jgi:hypothetical protein